MCLLLVMYHLLLSWQRLEYDHVNGNMGIYAMIINSANEFVLRLFFPVNLMR